MKALHAFQLDLEDFLRTAQLGPRLPEFDFQIEQLLGTDADVEPTEHIPGLDAAAEHRPRRVGRGLQRAGKGSANFRAGPRVGHYPAIDGKLRLPLSLSSRFLFQPERFGKLRAQFYDIARQLLFLGAGLAAFRAAPLAHDFVNCISNGQ